jgi:hypothetical protein
MTRSRLTSMVHVGIFAAGIACALLVGDAREAYAQAAEQKQCWYFWWQDPQCTFCAGACLPGGDCCTVNPS